MVTSKVCSALSVGALITIVGSGYGQLPPHSPVLNWSADYFTTTLGLTDGASLTGKTWLDRVSGTPASANGSAMTLETNEINGRPVVRDTVGTNQFWVQDTDMQIHAPDLFSGTNDYTFAAFTHATNPPLDPNNIGIAAIWSDNVIGQHQWYLSAEPDILGGGYMRTFCCGGPRSTFTPLSSFGLTTADLFSEFRSYTWVKGGGTSPVLTLGIDGVLSAVGGGTNPPDHPDLGTHNQGGFGRRLNFKHGQGRFRGDLAEIVFYDYALTQAQLADLEDYWIAKYLTPPLPGNGGDYNGDGVVDAADYIVWRKNLGSSGSPGTVLGDGTATGDLNGMPDGTVDQWDYDFWRQRFGNTVSGSGADQWAVPEPSMASLLLVGLLIEMGVRRRRLA